MRFTAEFLEELRSRISPSAVIGRKVALRQKGRGEHGGLCPFHKEKTPSFSVSDDKGFYHCFGCGAHGDIIKFTMDTTGMSFAESVEKLATEAGLPLPKFDKEYDERFKKITGIYGVLETVSDFFQKQLFTTQGRVALEYLEKRGINKTLIEKFQLGYAPDNFSALKDHLLKQGISTDMIVEAGVGVRNDKGEVFDRFRGRVIFPIGDAKGRIIAFGGRILGDGQPKYLNSPETELFKKGQNLYAWHLAKPIAREKNEVVVVEGYMDVIAMNAAGITNVVAPLGTAMTEKQLALLWQTVAEPTICLDGDQAGKRAMARVGELYMPLLKPGYSMKFAILPAGQDPDDVLKNEGPAFMNDTLTKARPLSELVWQVETEEERILPKLTPEQKAALATKLEKLTNSIGDNSVRVGYRDFFYKKLHPRKKENTEKTVLPQMVNVSSSHRSELEVQEMRLFEAILGFPKLLENNEIEEEFTRIEFSAAKLDNLRQNILEISAQNPEIGRKELIEDLEKAGFASQIKNISSNSFPDFEVASSFWRYSLAEYNLQNLENIIRTGNYDADSENLTEKLSELNSQVLDLKKIVEKEKDAYEFVSEGTI